MENNYEGPYAARLYEIDARIKDLNDRRSMWAKAGGMGGRMAMDSVQEVNELEAEKERILNGTQEKIDKLNAKIKDLQQKKKEHKKINVIKQVQLNREIKHIEDEILTLKR